MWIVVAIVAVLALFLRGWIGRGLRAGSTTRTRGWSSVRRWIDRHRGSTLGIAGMVLVLLGGVATFMFAMMLMNWDPALAGPGATDPRPFAGIALVVSLIMFLVGLLLARLGRRDERDTEVPPIAPSDDRAFAGPEFGERPAEEE